MNQGANKYWCSPIAFWWSAQNLISSYNKLYCVTIHFIRNGFLFLFQDVNQSRIRKCRYVCILLQKIKESLDILWNWSIWCHCPLTCYLKRLKFKHLCNWKLGILGRFGWTSCWRHEDSIPKSILHEIREFYCCCYFVPFCICLPH